MQFNPPSQLNVKPSFKTIRLIHFALLAGQCLFVAVVLFLRNHVSPDSVAEINMFLIVALALSVSGYFVGNLLFKQMVAVAAGKETFAQKLMVYQSALIIRYALIEGASLFSIVCLFLTGSFTFLLITGVLIIYFIFIRPKIDTIAENLT
jgi:hypothetical protein